MRVRWTSDFSKSKVVLAVKVDDLDLEGSRMRSVTALQVTPTVRRRAEAAMTVMALNCWLFAMPKIGPKKAPTLYVPIE